MIKLLYNNSSFRVLQREYFSGDIPINAGIKLGFFNALQYSLGFCDEKYKFRA